MGGPEDAAAEKYFIPPEMINFTWPDFDKAVDVLVGQLRPLHFKSVFGIPRGGLVLAVVLSHRLGVRLFTSPFDGSLVVDDISDTGRTLKYYQVRGYKTATIHRVPGTICEPDYWVVERPQGAWIVYPWEVGNNGRR